MQVLQHVSAGAPSLAETAAAAVLQLLLCLSLDITGLDLAGVLGIPHDSFLPLEAARLLSLTQLMWNRTGDGQQSTLAIKVCHHAQAGWGAVVTFLCKHEMPQCKRLCPLFASALACIVCWIHATDLLRMILDYHSAAGISST